MSVDFASAPQSSLDLADFVTATGVLTKTEFLDIVSSQHNNNWTWSPPAFRSKESRGFSLIELLVTVAVVSILAGVAVPSFGALISDTKISTAINRFTSTVRYARSESTKRAAPISICARATDTTCGTNWSNGWIVYLDDESVGTLLTLDSTDQILRINGPSNASSIVASAVIRPTTLAVQSTIQFSARGRSNWDLGTVVLCDTRGATEARALAINGIGMIRQLSSDHGSAPPDAFGTAVTCP